MSDNIMTLEPRKKLFIRKIVETFLLKIKSPYIVTPYAQDLHNLCCKFATEHGYPMGTDLSVSSLRPSIPPGVVIASIAFGHIEDEATRVFIALYTAFIVYVDDTYVRDNRCVSVFIEQFIRREKQLDPVLDGMASFLLEIPNYYESASASIILSAALNMVNSVVLDVQTQGMKLSLHARQYPKFTRRMSGTADAFAIMIFPRTIPVQNYIQCIPEAANFINYTNDIMSFYKEEIACETVNYISVLARSRGIPKMTAFEQLTNNVAEVHEHVCKILEADQEAYQAWQKFKDGYVGFHTSSKRYLLNDLMNYRNML